MEARSYLQWLAEESGTSWWHDSGDPRELESALRHGAMGVTTNPVLCAQAVQSNRHAWRAEILKALEHSGTPAARAEALTGIVVRAAARTLEGVHERTRGEQGYVCAQVDPGLVGQRDAMYAMARRFASWAPNIAVKLPATSSGLDVMERCCADGIAVAMTMSFTVSQVYAVGSRYQELRRRLRGAKQVGRCFAVIMMGRLDDYLREVCSDKRDALSEEEIRMAGLCVVKRSYEIYRANGFDATLLAAALRGPHHLSGIAGGKLIASIHPSQQKAALEGSPAHAKRIDEPIPPKVVARLAASPELRKAIYPDGIAVDEMVSYGLTQRTLAQFSEAGWKLLAEWSDRA